MNSSIINCQSVCKYYTNKNHTIKAVDEVNLQVYENETVLIKGRSGAGKSTLLSLMCGLEKPTNGKILIGNEDIHLMSDQELSWLLAFKVGMIFQSFNLLPTYTVFENIDIALEPTGTSKEERSKIILPFLDQFHLEDKTHFLASELSNGEQQKVAIVRTLVKKPSIIFADEPTGSVDEETAKEITGYLTSLKNAYNLTLVIATHGSFPSEFADRVVLMGNGKIPLLASDTFEPNI